MLLRASRLSMMFSLALVSLDRNGGSVCGGAVLAFTEVLLPRGFPWRLRRCPRSRAGINIDICHCEERFWRCHSDGQAISTDVIGRIAFCDSLPRVFRGEAISTCAQRHRLVPLMSLGIASPRKCACLAMTDVVQKLRLATWVHMLYNDCRGGVIPPVGASTAPLQVNVSWNIA